MEDEESWGKFIGVTKPEEADALLAEGAANLIGVGRALLKDADWTIPALAGPNGKA